MLLEKEVLERLCKLKKKDTGQIFAMKVLDKKHILDHNEVEHTIAEKNILQRLRHPFLVNLNWSFQTEDKLYFILDFVNGGELFFHLQREKKNFQNLASDFMRPKFCWLWNISTKTELFIEI